MKPVLMNSKSATWLAFATISLLLTAASTPAQAPQPTPTALDDKAQKQAEREAKKAAEAEERALKAAAEKERKEAEAAAKERDRARPAEPRRDQVSPQAEAPVPEGTTKDQERILRAEKQAQAEAEKARKKEEDRARAQEAKEADRRRKDEERAEKEAIKARTNEQKPRDSSSRKDQGQPEQGSKDVKAETDPDRERAARPTAPQPPGSDTPTLSREDERKRRELIKRIEKARGERDRMAKEAEDAQRIALAARTAAEEGQRLYEALTLGLEERGVEGAPGEPSTTRASDPLAPKKSRFVTRASERAAASKASPSGATIDPLRVALDLKSAEAETRERAAFSLASLGSDALPATRALMVALADTAPAVRVAAAQALGRIGAGASAAVAPLSASLTDPDPAVRNAAQAALLAIQGR